MPEGGTVTPLQEVYGEGALFDKYMPKRGRGRPNEGKGFAGLGANNLFKPEEHNNDTFNDLDLYKAVTPQSHIQHEKPEHRFLIYLFAQGHTTKEVFLQLGGEWNSESGKPIPGTGRYTYCWLTQIRKQAWFREQLTNFLHAAGKDLIAAKLETEVGPSLEVVLSIRDDENLPAAVRLRAADSLIDRHLGKPIQHTRLETIKSVDSFEKTAEALQIEMAQIDEQLKAHNASL